MKLSDVKLGDNLMVSINGTIIGGATSHTLSISPEYTDIACKDAGLYGWKKLNKIGWEVSVDALFTLDGFEDYLDKVANDTEVTLIFGMSDWQESGLTDTKESWTISDGIVSGKAKISSLTLNAASGDTATYSATFTGTSPFTVVS